MINLDLLTKLVRLANNNPNENEANLAARKVCKMIEEAKFNFNQTQPINSGYKPGQSQRENPTPRAQRQPSGPDHSRYYQGNWDFSGFTWSGFKPAPGAEQQKARASQSYEEFKKADAASQQYWDPYHGVRIPKEEKKKDYKRHLKCKTCGNIVETKFMGAQEVFVCNNCQWTEFEKSREGK